MGKRARRRQQEGRKRGGGLLSGLRGGFQRTVQGATGVGAADQPKSTRAKWIENTITVVLLVIAGLLLLRRFRH